MSSNTVTHDDPGLVVNTAREFNAAFHIGFWLFEKVQRQVAEGCAYQAARNLRKQGVPFDLALQTICPGARERSTTA